MFVFEEESAWIHVVPFSRIFAVQGFFLIVYVYLKEHGTKTKTKRAQRVSLASVIIIAVNAFTYGFCDAAVLYKSHKLDIIWNVIFVGLGFLLILIQIPFKFYLTKEFLFVLYDELKN